MKPKRLAVCPCCHVFYATQKDPYKVSCDECGTILKPVNYDFGMYNALSDDAKTSFKKKYIQEHYPNSKPYCKPFKPMPQSKSMYCVGCFGILILVFGVLAGLFTTVATSFQSGVSLLIGSLVSGFVLILLANVAEDVRHIRNRADELHHDIENEKKKRTA